jgi:hypothetical protein
MIGELNFDSLILKSALMHYKGEELVRKTISEVTITDARLDEVIEQFKGFLSAAGFHPDSIRKYIPDMD